MADDTPARRRQTLEVFASVDPPEVWSERQERDRPSLAAMAARAVGHTYHRPELASGSIDWPALGLTPRFLRQESAACVAALEPNTFHGQGADELGRFLDATSARGETALLVSIVGQVEEQQVVRNVFSRNDAAVSLAHLRGSVAGRRLPAGTTTQLAADLAPTDRDLALRLRNRPSSAPWWALQLTGVELHGSDGVERREPGGRLQPLVTNELGETLAGVWIPDEYDWRWYCLPAGTDWNTILDWLATQAIPEYVPNALRRTRSAELVDDELLTRQEITARNDLTRFESDAITTRQRLTDARDAAQVAADGIRFGLLYGTGQVLVDAVNHALSDAGFVVIDLDEELGRGKSGDLLASLDRRHWLVEVKSVSGNAGEDLYEDLLRHISTWPALARPEPLEGGALIVNHEHRQSPLDRARTPYTRGEFVQSLRHPVIPTLALFAWWRDGDHDAVINAVTGGPQCHQAMPAVPAEQRVQPVTPVLDVERAMPAPSPSPPTRKRRRWFRGINSAE
jgi:hypothetical protein